MRTSVRRGRLVSVLVFVLTLCLVLPAAAQQVGGGGGSGGGGGGSGGSGGEYADLVIAYRDANGVPIVIGPFENEFGEQEYCVQPITTETVPNPLFVDGGTPPEYLPTVTNPVDGRAVTLVPLFAHYPQYLPDDEEPTEAASLDVEAAAPPEGSEEEEGGAPCDPLVIPEVHDYSTYTTEVELERLNLARAPDNVIDRHLTELELLFRTTDPSLVTLDPAGRITFDGVATDAMPKLQGLRRSLMTTGTVVGADEFDYPFPFRLTHREFRSRNTWELTSFALGGAASKFGSINVDVVAYHDRIMGIASRWLDADPAGWPPKLHTYSETGERFVDYSSFTYDRGDVVKGCVTYLDPATWREGYKVERLLDAVTFTTRTPKQDNIAGYAQMAEDARAVVLFFHDYEPVIDHADSPGLNTCAAQEARLPILNDGEFPPPPPPPTDPTDPVSPWSDVSATNVHLADLLALHEDGIFLGFADGTFRPGDPVTRGQVASVLARTMGLEGTLPATPTFSDLANSGHALSVELLAAEGIIEGYPDGTFRPSDPIRRDQTASLIGRWLGVEEVADGPFVDVPVGGIHSGYINALYEEGIIKGTSPTTFEPRLDIRRDQFGALVNRAR